MRRVRSPPGVSQKRVWLSYCYTRCGISFNIFSLIKEYQFEFVVSAEDLSMSGLKWAPSWQRWTVPTLMWRSTGNVGKNLGSSPTSNNTSEGFNCAACGRVYKLKSSLRNHQKWECGKEPQFQCPHCVYRAKQKMHIARHMERMHKEKIYKNDIAIE